MIFYNKVAEPCEGTSETLPRSASWPTPTSPCRRSATSWPPSRWSPTLRDRHRSIHGMDAKSPPGRSTRDALPLGEGDAGPRRHLRLRPGHCSSGAAHSNPFDRGRSGQDIKHYRKAGILGLSTEPWRHRERVLNLYVRGQIYWNPDADVSDALLPSLRD